jgi:DNA polymerase III delta subunit
VATFIQHIRRRYERAPRRLTWVCGSDEWLRLEVVKDLVERYAQNRAWYDISSANGIRDFWASAFQYGIDDEPRVIVGTRAHKVSDWDKLELWASEMRTMPKLYLIFDSDDHKIESDKDHVAMIRDKGDVIRCAPPKEADTFEWLSTEFDTMSATVINAVIDRTMNDPRRSYQLCDKLAMFGNARPEHVALLGEEFVAGDFVDYVVLGDKKRAMALVETIEPRQVLGLFVARLRQMQEMHRAFRTNTHANVPVFVERRFEKVAGRYNQAKVAHARRLLAAADEATKRGPAVGALEMLVRSW